MLLKNTYLIPHGDHYHVMGEVYGHSQYIDGTNICTSRVVSFNRDESYLKIKTRNSVYEIDLDTCHFDEYELLEL